MSNQIQPVIGATVVAVLAISMALLVTAYDHDLARAVACIGFTSGTVIGVAIPIYNLLDRRLALMARATDRRLARMEQTTIRAIDVEYDLLLAVREAARFN